MRTLDAASVAALLKAAEGTRCRRRSRSSLVRACGVASCSAYGGAISILRLVV